MTRSKINTIASITKSCRSFKKSKYIFFFLFVKSSSLVFLCYLLHLFGKKCTHLTIPNGAGRLDSKQVNRKRGEGAEGVCPKSSSFLSNLFANYQRPIMADFKEALEGSAKSHFV